MYTLCTTHFLWFAGPVERNDSAQDRNFSDLLVGKRIRGHYEDGWHSGTINYYNTKLREYHIEFDDSTEDDYVKKSEIDGINIILLD